MDEPSGTVAAEGCFNGLPWGICAAMNVKEASRRARRAEQMVLRLQRRLWFAQLALWPTVVLSGILVMAAAWALWRRKSDGRQADTVPPGSDSPNDVDLVIRGLRA
jgi:hypothetical protein